MGEILDIIAAIVFFCLVAPKTVIISRSLSIHIPRAFLWKASIGSFAISLTAFLIIAAVTLPLVVAIAYSLSSSEWLQAGPYLTGYIFVTIFPGLFYERHMLLKGGVDRSIALKMCVISNLYMVFLILGLALSLYIIAMEYF